MASQSPASVSKMRTQGVLLSERLKHCWDLDLNWSLFPVALKEGCDQVGRALCMPSTAVLSGLIVITCFCMSHSVVEVEETEWIEPVILWIAICMPTGSGKSSLCKYLRKLVLETRSACLLDGTSPPWFLDDQSFEKLGALMDENHSKSLGLYDELSMFLTQLNVFRARGVMESHELAVFLKFYGGDSWTRRTVSGEANFAMEYTSLTIGGFMQPSIARNIVEHPLNVDKGLCQRFLWVMPKPNPVHYDDMEKINKEFTVSMVGLFKTLWRNDKSIIRRWIFPRPCSPFKGKNDLVWQQVDEISCADELLSGMLSKSRGQVIRVATTLHVLFNFESPLTIPDKISIDAITAAVDFVDYCLQNAAFLAGRTVIADEIEGIIRDSSHPTTHADGQAKANASFILLQPGKTLYLNALLEQRKFRDHDNKDGAVRGLKLLQEAGLGNLIEIKPQRGANMMYQFNKANVPDEAQEWTQFMDILVGFGVSLTQYKKAMSMDNVTMQVKLIYNLSYLEWNV